VIAHTTDDFVFFKSLPASGYSVDNLAPPAPLYLTAQRSGSNVNLRWNRVHVSDLHRYSVYRKTSSGVTPVPVNFLSDTVDTVLVDAGAPASALYYVVTASDAHANQGNSSNEAGVSATTNAGNLPPITALTVLQNHPNPFAATTSFDLGLPSQARVEIDVFDIAGRRVSTQLLGLKPAGWQKIALQSSDSAGRRLASGVYFFRVSANGETLTRKMVIAR